MDFLSIFLYIPFIEIILLPLICINGIEIGKEGFDQCSKGIHFLKISLGIISSFLFLIFNSFMIIFSFFPFQKYLSTIRMNSANDFINIIIKSIIILQNLFIKNEYISLALLIISSFIMFYKCYNEPTYNNNYLEIIITIKNLVILWTYFVLLLSKFFKDFKINGFIFLLVLGYPVVVYLSILLFKEKNMNFTYLCGNPHNLRDLLNKAKLNIRFINTFIEKNKSNRNENERQRNSVL